jgi:flagellar FliL protein
MAEEDNQVVEAPPQTSDKNPMIAIILILNLVALGAVAFFQFKFFQQESGKPSVSELVKQELDKHGSKEAIEEAYKPKEEEGLLLPMEGFTVNLAQSDGPRRYLRLKAVLKFNQDSKEEEFQARKPQIRDAVISILNSKRPEDLLKREGKAFLKEEIKSAINAFLIEGKVIDIYYVGFQIN